MYAILAAFILAATPAWAQSAAQPTTHTLTNNATGEKIGTMTVSGNRAFVRDINEKLLGTIVVNKDGSRTSYDPDGNVVHQIEPKK